MKTGTIVLFGKYKQNMLEEKTDIPWIVLELEEEKALLVSQFALEAMHYNEMPGEITWEKCSLRDWLNHSFYESAFLEKEKENILLTRLKNRDPEQVVMYETHEMEGVSYPEYIPARLVSAPTDDRVFLLSSEEVLRYQDLLEESGSVRTLMVLPTEYALRKGVHERRLYSVDDSGFITEDYVSYCDHWWLRNRLKDGNRTACVIGETIGEFFTFFHEEVLLGVRPAIWVRTDVLQDSF